jgi:hypothetical protein
MSTTRMKRSFREFCNNKTEQIHGLVVNVFSPERFFYCCTICGKAQTYMAVGIDSVGYKEYFKELYDNLGIKMSMEATTHYPQHDKKTASNQVHGKKEETKKKCAMTKLAIKNQGWAKEVQDKKHGHAYQ